MLEPHLLIFIQWEVRIYILFVTSIHQFIFTKPRLFFNEIWCYDYFYDAVKCILMPPQDLEKVGWLKSRKSKK